MDLTKMLGLDKAVNLKAIEQQALDAKKKQEEMLQELRDINKRLEAIIGLLGNLPPRKPD